MTKDLVNALQLHRNASWTKGVLSQLLNVQKKLLKKYPKYLFHKSYYLNDLVPIRVLCRSHGFFYQTPQALLKGVHCPSCKAIQDKKSLFIYKGIKYNHSSFLEACSKANGYDYSQAEFKGFKKSINVFCKVHRYFKVTKPHLCLSTKFICPRCRGSSKVIN